MLIQDFVRYDKSQLWDIHNDYFLSSGLKAWKSGEVPYTGISNYSEAYKKARLVIDNLGNRKDPVKILELGAGYGEFAINFVKAFKAICEAESLEYFKDFKYFISDYAQKTLDELSSSSRFQDSDLLDKFSFIKFDIYEDDIEQIKKQLANCDAIFANYVLDQFPARIFAKKNSLLEKGSYYEAYISLIEPEPNFFDKLIFQKKRIKRLKKIYEFREINLDFDLEIPFEDMDILKKCFRKNKDSTIIYSYGALKVLKRVMNLINDNGLIICSDFNASSKPGFDKYEPCYYGDSLAQAVNFELLYKSFSDSQKVLLYEDPIKPLHTLILTNPDFQQALELGENYNKIYKQNILWRTFYKFLVELQLAFWLFALIFFGSVIFSISQP